MWSSATARWRFRSAFHVLPFRLGRDADSRTEIWNKVGKLYTTRSKIVHGEDVREEDTDIWQIANDGYELAFETLQKLIHWDGEPIWNNVVLSGDGRADVG